MLHKQFEKVHKYLEAQKQRMLQLDEASGELNRERNRIDWSGRDKETGRRVGLREMVYSNTIEWILSEEGYQELGKEFELLSRPGVIDEDTLTTQIATFTTSLLPAVRRIYNNLIAMDLISVQPLKGPTGYIYYVDFTYDTATAEVAQGARLDLNRPRVYADSGEQAPIREINMRLQKKLIETKTKKLLGEWTLEAQQDMRSQWGLDAPGEIIGMVIDEVLREIDIEVIDALILGAAHIINWNPTGYLVGDTDSVTQRQYRRGIYDAICDAKAEIQTTKRPKRADWWLVMHPRTFARLQKLEEYSADPLAIDQEAGVHHRYEGTINKLYKVYVNPDISECYILMGIRGDWQRSVGYYAPYIPLFTSEEYIVRNDFTQRAKGAMTRYDYGIIPEVPTGTTNNGIALINICVS